MDYTYSGALVAAGWNVIAEESFGSYQGDWWALVERDGKRGWIHDSFGSCSGCDTIEGMREDWECRLVDEHRWGDSDPKCEGCKAGPAKFKQWAIDTYGDAEDLLATEQALAKAKEYQWDEEAAEAVKFIEKHGAGA